MIGEMGVGKTCLLRRYIDPYSVMEPKSTLGCEFITKTFTFADGSSVKANLWDTTGQEKYKAIVSAHCRKALGAVVVYDVTERASFEALPFWIELVTMHADPNMQMILVGNKVDLVESNPSLRKVFKSDIDSLRSQYADTIKHVETSAKTLKNVHDAFEGLLRELHSKKSISV